ncbi:MAG: RNA 2',3'-cyclic phosphodiesterase [Candidatus Omnitrophota bacterium]
MNTIRAFIGVNIGIPAKQQILELINHLKKSNSDVKWVGEPQMHLTLKFLGDIEQDKIPEISNTLKSIALKSSVFEISFSGIGAFPTINRPRIIWLGIGNGSDNLRTLAALVEKEMENMGFTKEERDYKAHLTLGRVRSQKNIKELSKLLSETSFKYQANIRIDRLTLFQSTLTQKGAIYTILSEANLASAQA